MEKSPINVLFGNIINRFENIQSNTLDDHYKAFQSGYISQEIAYDDLPNKVKTPSSDTKSRQIYLQETYLTYLWSYIYSIFVIHEEGIQKRMINNTWDGIIQYDSPLLISAKDLFLWSISLIDTYSCWDKKLPNPEKHTNEQEKFYAEKVNGIFQDAVTFIMFHEFAHLTLGHDIYYESKENAQKKEEKNYNLHELEKDSDNFAFSILVKEDDEYSKQLTSTLAVQFVMTSSFLLEPKKYQTIQHSHPTLDNRLFYFFQNMRLKDEKHDFYIKYISSLGLRMYLEKDKILDINENIGIFDTIEDITNFYLEKLDQFRIKLQNNQ